MLGLKLDIKEDLNMNKPFSEMVEDELFNTRQRYSILNDISKELDNLLYENAYLKAENKELDRRIRMYQNSVDEGIKESRAVIATALRACLNKED
jgi:cell division septum initiation protein DivIVA